MQATTGSVKVLSLQTQIRMFTNPNYKIPKPIFRYLERNCMDGGAENAPFDLPYICLKDGL